MDNHNIPEFYFGGNNPDENEERASFYDGENEMRFEKHGK